MKHVRRIEGEYVNEVPPNYRPLVFWVHPDKGSPYKVDLTSLTSDHYPAPGDPRAKEAGDRHLFVRGFAQALCVDRSPHTSYAAKCTALRAFLRFLKDDDPEGYQMFPEMITDDMGLRLQLWLEDKGSRQYSQIRALVSQIRAVNPPFLYRKVLHLLWPPGMAFDPAAQKEITLDAVQSLNRAFVEEAREIKAMFAEGSRLVLLSEAAEDRRDVGTEDDRRETIEWHAWLAKETLSIAGRLGRMEPAAFQGPPHAPRYLVPGIKRIDGHRLDRKLRWFTFGRRDAIVFLWLFVLGTGWNLSTALALDISSDRRWCRVDRLSPEHRVIHAYKERAKARQYVTSLEQPEWFPYQIVRFMIERTEPLRAILRRRLAADLKLARTDRSMALASRIAELRLDLKSPWLFVTDEGGVGAARLTARDGSLINKTARAVVEKHDLQHPELADWVVSDARDIRIRHAYETSGFDAIVAQATGGHATMATSRHYVGAASLDAVAEKRFRAMQSAIFAGLEGGGPLDLTKVRILVENGTITHEQERRLHDHRMRTRVGMGCLDHTKPPPRVAPGHPAGEPCAVQKCAACPQGVVMPDSLDGLARRAVELRVIHGGIAHASWSKSSFDIECQAVEAALETFDPDDVREAMATWQKRFEEGHAVVQDTFPSY